MTDDTLPTSVKQETIVHHIWTGQIILGVIIGMILLILGEHALGLKGWVAPILLVGVAFYGLHSIMTMAWRGLTIAVMAAVTLIIVIVLFGG